MYSEKYISREFGYFWRACLPGLTPNAIAALKEGKLSVASISKWAEQLQTIVPSKFNDLIAELAFNSFASCILSNNKKSNDNLISQDDIHSAIGKISAIRGRTISVSEVTVEMLRDSLVLRRRLLDHFAEKKVPTFINPRLQGYGKLSTCHADMISGASLIEIKSSKFFFRINDFRQLSLYAFLSLEAEIPVDNLVLINPRRGEKITFPIGSFFRYFGHTDFCHTLEKMRNKLV
jgi:hypothetical protein